MPDGGKPTVHGLSEPLSMGGEYNDADPGVPATTVIHD